MKKDESARINTDEGYFNVVVGTDLDKELSLSSISVEEIRRKLLTYEKSARTQGAWAVNGKRGWKAMREVYIANLLAKKEKDVL